MRRVSIKRFRLAFISFTAVMVAILTAASGVTARADSKRYEILMNALGKSDEPTKVSPQRLDDLEEFLSGTGTPRAEAQEAISAALRAPFLKSSAVLEIVPLARDIGAVMGNDIVRETREFLGAFGRGGEAAIRYCMARNALSAEEIIKLRYMDQHAQSLNALGEAVDQLQKRFGGSYERLRATSAH